MRLRRTFLIASLSLICFTIFAQSSDEKVYTIVEQMPRFIGGEVALNQYISDSLRYPELAKKAGIRGTVYLQFTIEKDGSLADIKVMRGIGGGCDEEALKLVKAMPKWLPGRQASDIVRCSYNLPIKFEL
ncbi:MAG: energy transducer TonB [Flavobacteriales bacterium]|nr:energy transducer TonB [Flavobacteriales bacterium]